MQHMYPDRMGKVIYLIPFPKPKQDRVLVVILSLIYLLKQNVNVILCLNKVSLAKTS